MTSVVVLSLVYQTENLGLQSPNIIANKSLFEVVPFKIFSKSEIKFSNSIISWLGDPYMTPTYSILYIDFTKSALIEV